MVLRIVLAIEGVERFSRLQAPLYYTHGFVMKKGIAYYRLPICRLSALLQCFD
jgi:hypothetical protein